MSVMTNAKLELAIVKLTAAVMSLARDVIRGTPDGISEETSEKCVDATSALYRPRSAVSQSVTPAS